MLAKATDEILEKTAHIQILDIPPPKKKIISDFFENDKDTILEKCFNNTEKTTE